MRSYFLRSNKAFPILSVYVALQALIMLSATAFDVGILPQRMLHLDSWWYTHMANNGYGAAPDVLGSGEMVFAFFPLWPLLLRLVATMLPGDLPPQIVGSVLSFFIFGAWVIFVAKPDTRYPNWLKPRTMLGLWLFVFAPASWVFASNHTEALFLVLSYAAFCLTWRNQLLPAAICAGLACLTRNQGVLVAISCALLALQLRREIWSAAAFLVIAGLIASVWPLYQWHATGNFFASSLAQKHWPFIADAGEYVTNILWLSRNNCGRAGLMWAGIVTSSYWVAKKPTSRAIGVYTLLSCLLLPLQGNNLPQAYRFTTVLFPLWFVWGDTIARLLYKRRISRPARVGAIAVIAVVAFYVAATRGSYYYNWLEGKPWPY